MKLPAMALALIGVIVVPAEAAEQCPPLKILASLDMDFERGRVLVPVTVGDEQLYFVLATAVPYSAISAHYAETHNFPRYHSNISYVGLSGQVSDKMTTVPSLGLDQMKSEHFSLVLMDMHDDAAPPGARVPHGVLGADILRSYDVELDFARAKVNLISRDHCSGVPVYWPSQTMATLPMLVTDSNKITFTMTLDGHEMQTILNTGIPTSTLKLSVAKEVFDIDNDSAGNKPAGSLGNGTQLFAHRFQSLSVEGLSIANPTLVLMPSLADEKIEHMRNLNVSPARGPIYVHQQPDVALGLAELRRLHIYIDYHHQTVYMTPATAAQTAAH